MRSGSTSVFAIARCWWCFKAARVVRDPAEPSVCCAMPKCVRAEQKYQQRLAQSRQVELVADPRLT